VKKKQLKPNLGQIHKILLESPELANVISI